MASSRNARGDVLGGCHPGRRAALRALGRTALALLPAGCATRPRSAPAVAAGDPTAASLAQGLAAHLPLVRDLRDHSAAGHPVGVHGRVAIVDGVAVFPGRDAWLELPYLDLFGEDFCVALWVKVLGVGETHGLVQQHDEDRHDRHLHLMLRGGLRPYFGFYLNDVRADTAVQPRVWTHLAFQFSRMRKQIWLNGVRIAEQHSAHYAGTRGGTFIGRHPRWKGVPVQDFEGFMRDVRIYRRALSPSEVQVLHRDGLEWLRRV